jgi:hypothetical protein
VYNFYNCCTPSQAAASSSSFFIWQSGDILDPQAQGLNIPERLAPVLAISNAPDADLKTYQGLTPLHRTAHLNEISLLRLSNDAPLGPPYTGTIVFNLVVLDFNGTVIRTISTSSINYVAVPFMTWTPIALSTLPGDLDIPAGQLVAGELTFGTALASGQLFFARYQLTGTGTF